MDHKHFQWTKRPFSVIFKSTLTNQVSRYKQEGQVRAKIMLEQKADFFKTRLKLVLVLEQYKNVTEIDRLNAFVN